MAGRDQNLGVLLLQLNFVTRFSLFDGPKKNDIRFTYLQYLLTYLDRHALE